MYNEGVFIGQFEITSGKMRVTDPCYSKGTWCSGVFNAANGKWNAYIGVSDEGSWGDRVSELVVMNEDAGYLFNWQLTNIDVGVDSGQAGFFDEAKYPDGERTGEYEDLNTFYGQVCEMTLSRKQAGVLPFGVASSSGYGDGSYRCYVAYNNNNEVVAARIQFIDDNYEEDEDY